MTLEKNMMIGNVPALEIRDIFKTYCSIDSKITKLWFNRLENKYGEASSKIIDNLLECGFIEKSGIKENDGEVFYNLTRLGSQFSVAKATQRKNRKSAEKILSELLERVLFVNKANTIFLREIASVILFGSYLEPSNETLGDLDLIITTREKNIDVEEIEEKYRKEHKYWSYIHWKYQEEDKALRFLKARNSFISLHGENDLRIPDLKTKEVFNIDACEKKYSIDELLSLPSVQKGLSTL